MFQRKRQLKKEKHQSRIKITLVALLFLTILLIVFEYLFLNFSLGRTMYINPIARNNASKIVYLENELEKSKISFKTVSQNYDGSLVITLLDNSFIILSTKKDIKNQISSLQLILSRLTIEGKKLKSLDFRFNNPVVSY